MPDVLTIAMATENGAPIRTRAEFLTGQTIERVEECTDAEHHEVWTVLWLANGAQVHIREDCGWVLVDALVN